MSWFIKTASDAAVVLRVRAGRRDEFAALVDRYLPVAHAVCYAQLRNVTDAEDAAQDAFIKAYEALDGLREPAKFGPWLLSIVRNVCRNHQRSRAREKERTDALAALGQEPAGQPVDQDLRPVVRAQIDALDAIHREVLLLHYYGGRSIKDIAALLELSPDAVKKRLQRAREALSARMLQHLEPAVAPQHAHKDRVKTIMGLLAGVTAAWEAGAASTSGVAAGAGAAGVASGVASSMVAKIVAGVAAAIAVTGAVMYWPEAGVDVSPDATPQSAIAQDATTLASATTSVTDPTDRTDPSDPTDNPTTTPEGGYFIHGRTVDQAGNPVPGAVVTVDPFYAEDGRHHEAVSDQDGSFTLKNLNSTTYIVRASGSDHFAMTDLHSTSREKSNVRDVVMYPSGPVAGRVQDSNGNPVQDAWVVPIAGTGVKEDWMLHPRWYYLRRVKTGQDGRFQIDAVWLGECSLLVDSPTYVVHETDMIPVEKPASITLRPGARVAGQLIYANTKAPVPGVRLLIDRDRETVSDEEGRFFFQGVKPGQNAVRVEHETLFSLQPGFIVPEGGDVFGVALEVVQGGIIEGRVYDAQTGEGILMADIRIERESGADSTFSRPEMTTANNEGEFKFTKLLPGTYRVEWADATEYVRSVVPDHEPLEVDYWKTISGVDLGLMKGATIRGTIVAPPEILAQQPMVSFRYVDEAVQVRQDEHRSSGSQSDGRFRLAGLLPGEPVILRAGGGKWKSAEAGPFTPGMDGIDGVTLTLLENPLGSVSGKLVYGNGLAVAQGDVELQHVDGSHIARAEVDEHGTFKIENLPAGNYELGARAYNASLPEPLPISIAAGEALTGIVIDFGGGGEVIAGHVMDDTGTPIPGAEVRVRGPDFGGAPQTSGEHGEFVVQGLAPSSYDVSVRAEGYSARRLKAIATGTTDLRVVLEREGSIDGRVIQGQTGHPLKEFEVAVTTPQEMARGHLLSLRFNRFVSDTGAFRVDNCSPGTRVVVARAAGLFPASAEVVVLPGQPVTVPALVLGPGAVAHVTVVNAQGQPLQGAEVFPNGWPDLGVQLRPDKGSTKTNAEGIATLENLVPGTNLFFVTHSDYVPSQFELDVRAGATLSPTFTLQEGGVLEGVVAADGSPVAEAHVRLSYADSDLPGFEHFHTKAQTDAHGAYRIPGLVSGEVIINVHVENQKLQRHIAVSRGKTSRADFIFEGGTASVTGTVRYTATEPELEQTMLMLDVATPAGLVRYVAPPDPNGRFAFDNVQAGEAELMAVGIDADGGRRMKVAALTISSGSRMTQHFDFGQGAKVQGIAEIHSDHPEFYAVLVAGDLDVRNLNNAAYALALHERTIGEVQMDAAGRFQFDAVDPGEYTLIVVTDDLGEKIGTPVTVGEGEAVVNVNIAFP
ncbi:MAG: hypothetical protein AMXMBFR82_18970 [Candidatus Hydrogenedentota bacterium]